MTHLPGVTVYKSHQDVPRGPARNILELAAQTDDLELAINLVAGALCITDLTRARANLPDQRRWAYVLSSDRLKALSAWMQAECSELRNHVEFTSPMALVGTND